MCTLMQQQCMQYVSLLCSALYNSRASNMEASNNSTITDCFITDTIRIHLLIVLVSVSGASFVICVLSLLSLLYSACKGKKLWSKVSVRLFLYLIAAAMVQSVVFAFQTTTIHYNENDPTEKYSCIVVGFLNQYSSWVVILFAMVATAHTMIMAILKYTNRDFRPKIEYFYALFPIILPLTFSWIPFIHDLFGLSGAWCWIQKYDENCTFLFAGYTEQYVLWYAPQWLIFLISLICLVVFSVVQCKTDMSRSDRMYLLQQTLPLLVTSVLIELSTFVGLAVHTRTHTHTYTSTVLWLVHAVSSSFWGAIAGVMFMIYQCVVVTRPNCKICKLSYEPIQS